MTDMLEYIEGLERDNEEMRELLFNIVVAFDTNDQLALEGFITQAQKKSDPLCR